MPIIINRFIKSCILIILLGFYSQGNNAQEGYPFMLNISLKEITDPQVFSISQDNHGNMLFVTRQGIVIHDGETMEMLQLPAFPFTLKSIQNHSKVYVGCNQQFGYIETNSFGTYEYHRISETYFQPGDVIRIANHSDNIYFAGDYSLARVSQKTNNVEKSWTFLSDTLLTGLFSLEEKIFVQFNEEGLTELVDDIFRPLAYSANILTGEIIFTAEYDASRVLIGTSDQKLFLFDGRNFKEFKTEYDSYLNESMVIGAVMTGENKIVFSTLIGGLVVVEKTEGKKVLILNNNTGLPDDEIYAIGADRYGGVWVSHASGLTRADFNFPARIYNSYSGLYGNLQTIAFYEGRLYAGGNEGVFVLNEKKSYLERDVVVRARPSSKTQLNTNSLPSGSEKEALTKREIRRLEREEKKLSGSQEASKRGFLSRLLSVFKSDGHDSEEDKEASSEFIRRKIYKLQSVSHEFEKVAGINEKCKQLLLTKAGLVAVTSTAAYLVEGNHASLIKKDNFIRFASVSLNPESFFIVGGRGIYHMILVGKKWNENLIMPGYEQNIYSLVEKSPGTIWLGSDNLIQRIQLNRNKPPQMIFIPVERNFFERVQLKNVNDTLFVFLSTGVYTLDNNTLNPYFSEETGSVPSQRILSGARELFWLKSAEGWTSIAGEPYSKDMDEFLGIFKNIQQIFYHEPEELWVLDQDNRIYRLITPSIQIESTDFHVFVKSISNQQGMKFPLDSLKLKHENSSLEFTVSAPGFIREGSTQYQYFLDGLMKNWSKWSNNNVIEFPVLPPGKYVLRVRAKNVLGQLSNEQSVDFEIKPPFRQTIWFYLLIALGIVSIFFLIIKIREFRLQKDKRELEYKVRKRTREIEKQKDEIEKQKSKIQIQHDQIFLQNKEITDSIFYARRIQSAVMPPVSDLNKIFPANFVLFQPRDIVSGDFYWFKSLGKKAIIVAADCTGHGVPGAFMSMLGITLLNDLTIQSEWSQASHILNELRDKVKETLSQKGIAGEASDGMDISLCLFDFENKSVDYAGAFSPLYIFRNGSLMEFKADRMPIGIHFREQKEFVNHRIELLPGDIFYMFSDGYYSQIGGKDGKRFLSGNFKKLLQEIHKEPMEEQSLILVKKLDEWMGAHMQVDDVLVMGFRYR
jgi:serine phosphatase RsbU (regulator of sigma subunit)